MTTVTRTPRALARRASWIALALLVGRAGLFVTEAGCKSSADGGVHVVVSLDPATWPTDDSYPFDHVTVTAKGGGKIAVVCLFAAGGSRELEVDAGSADPCADLPTPTWSTPPHARDWGTTKPRRINFVFPVGVDVAVTAFAAFGGSRPMAIASGNAAADAVYPEVPLVLALDKSAVPDCGVVVIGRELVPNALTALKSDLCNAPIEACPLDPREAREGGAHTSAMTCAGDASRIDPRVHCDKPQLPGVPEFAFTVGTHIPSCGAVFLRGHFATCKDGSRDPNCELVAACTPPIGSKIVWLPAPGNPAPPGSVELSCVPPFAYPVIMTYQFQGTGVPAPTGDLPPIYAAGGAFDPAAASQPGACFFQFYSISAGDNKDARCGDGGVDAAIGAADAGPDAADGE
jgi:hypothetical protein